MAVKQHQGYGDNYDDELTVKVVNISALVAGREREIFTGPAYKKGGNNDVRIPHATPDRPYRELPKKVAAWLLQHHGGPQNGGNVTCGDRGLRVWRSAGPLPEAPEDRKLMEDIKECQAILKGDKEARPMTPHEAQPYMPQTMLEQMQMGRNIPDESWSVVELDSWAKRNSVEFPDGLSQKGRVAMARNIALAFARRGMPVSPPAATRPGP